MREILMGQITAPVAMGKPAFVARAPACSRAENDGVLSSFQPVITALNFTGKTVGAPSMNDRRIDTFDIGERPR